ncbi:hypothetical protein IFM89_022929 [Coptis chinensis]|uniref:Uncharacterized protein n=1 Tax=Coptis chinensis TaxID=261450 RepID=A0A835I4L8_9MAGN|nr:hypothetical protein IFM89_022929 [Coptis chinensis]
MDAGTRRLSFAEKVKANASMEIDVSELFRKIWLEHNQFMNMLKLRWNGPMCDGPIRLVMRKLKRLKGTLKVWHKNTYWGTRDKIVQANQSLKDIQKQQEEKSFDVQLHLQEVDTEKLISNLMHTEATMWKQRACIKEELKGDRNSGYSLNDTMTQASTKAT